QELVFKINLRDANFKLNISEDIKHYLLIVYVYIYFLIIKNINFYRQFKNREQIIFHIKKVIKMANREDFRQKFRELDAVVNQGNKKEKMQIVTNEKMINSKTIHMNLEDHTIGNLMRMHLLKNKEVKFAGYKVPHPLEPKLELKVQTVKDNTNQILIDTIDTIMRQVETMQDSFLQQVRLWEN
ncbi:DNA-directed RNA polymerase II 13.3 kDa proteinRPB11, partial (macronuclear) [Tetrahymena thermophila SB210]